jgi:hypothetical protein
MTATSTKEAIKGSGNWRDATVDLITYYTNESVCFSSGEIAAELRTHRTDLMFSVLNLGEYTRDLYYNGQINYTDDDGDDLAALQVARTTTGTGRTPAGRTVFVYGPDPAEAQSHDFEVDIPDPGVKKTGSSPIKPKGGYPTAVTSGGGDGTAAPAAMTQGDKLGSDEIQATVHTDKRLCITRPIFDRFIAASGQPLRGGDPVWIAVTDDEARVTIEDPNDDDAKKYDLSKERGRVLFAHPSAPFDPGDHYKVTISKDALVIDLSGALG